jgi:hypothetical protein
MLIDIISQIVMVKILKKQAESGRYDKCHIFCKGVSKSEV